MAQNDEVTYEVLLLSNDRWEAQGVYTASEQMLAVTDAKSLARVSTVQGVKVVKEFYDSKMGASRSLTIYEHKPGAKQRPGAPQGARGGLSAPGAEAEPEKPKKSGSILGVITKILLSIIFSAVTAMAVTQLSSMALKGVHRIGMLDKEDLLIIVFLLVFVITALALVTRILVNMKRIGVILPSFGGTSSKPAPVPKRVRNHRLTPSAEKNKKADQKADKKDEKDKADQGKAEETEAAKVIEADAEAKKAEEEAQKAEEEARNKAQAAAEKQAEIDALSQIITMKAFSDDALDVIQGAKDKQDANAIFGLVLFLVGAVQALRQERDLPENITNTVMHKTLSSLGLSKERIDKFSNSIDDYLVSNPRYSQMFQAGRGAMGTYLESEIGPRGALSDAIDEWKKPKAQATATNKPVTVLFTDIAGSTAMTQKLGDAGAQDVVRIHNQIVRDAIKTFSGREVKHTGDGIMASFPSAVQGVEAAMDMQKQTKKHNDSGSDRPLGLKIGLNAGEPISEENDLYGTTVQLAARIVDKADAGEILVSSSVHGLSQGKNLKFERSADFDMKGFDEAVTVYLAYWDGFEPKKKPEESKGEDKDQDKPVEAVVQKAESDNSKDEPVVEKPQQVQTQAQSQAKPAQSPVKPVAQAKPASAQQSVEPATSPAATKPKPAVQPKPVVKPAAVTKTTNVPAQKPEPRVTKDPESKN
ncbi:MAG: hypothetical protein OQK24_05725 [Magnetovibrio sp.]|nr:hypothetical protein [Magnetovibrio sp.]